MLLSSDTNLRDLKSSGELKVGPRKRLNISHHWLLTYLPFDKKVLSEFLKTKLIEPNYSTHETSKLHSKSLFPWLVLLLSDRRHVAL